MRKAGSEGEFRPSSHATSEGLLTTRVHSQDQCTVFLVPCILAKWLIPWVRRSAPSLYLQSTKPARRRAKIRTAAETPALYQLVDGPLNGAPDRKGDPEDEYPAQNRQNPDH